MNLKNRFKRFWTLDVHNHEGFTLVELIIVIAILAILSTGAIAGYSAYVEKANKTADEALVAEVKSVLTLAYYSNEINESGYVVLTMNGANVSDDAVSAALQAAFSNLNGLKLKYSEWAEGGDFGSYASSVNGSFVTNGTDALLKDVENCTGKLAEFMIGTGLFEGKEGATRLDGLLQSNGALSGMLEDYKDADINQIVLANAAVFGLAASLTNGTNADAVINNFANMQYLMMPIAYTGNPNALTETANKYAALEAFVKFVNCDGATKALNNFNTSGMDSEDPGTIINNLNNACSTAWNAVFMDNDEAVNLKGMEYYGMMLDDMDIPVANPNVTKSPARQDGEAYVSTMQAVDSLSGDYAASLGNAGMFTDGTITSDLDTYLNLATDIPAEGAYYVISFRIDENGINFDK
jgi:prepilin-type N-terminal cleavage/methylation domain-containing protein